MLLTLQGRDGNLVCVDSIYVVKDFQMHFFYEKCFKIKFDLTKNYTKVSLTKKHLDDPQDFKINIQ